MQVVCASLWQLPLLGEERGLPLCFFSLTVVYDFAIVCCWPGAVIYENYCQHFAVWDPAWFHCQLESKMERSKTDQDPKL